MASFWHSYFDANANLNALYEVRALRGAVGGDSAGVIPNGTVPTNEAVAVEPNTPLTSADGTSVVSAPVVSGQVYSSSAVEIFWNRASEPGVTYNIYRNGVLIRAQSPGTSQFDPELAAGTTYLYTVEATQNGSSLE